MIASKIGSVAVEAGTYDPICAKIAATAVALRYVVFPPILGPVKIINLLFSSRKTSFGTTSTFLKSKIGWRSSSSSIFLSSVNSGRHQGSVEETAAQLIPVKASILP